jgi:PadR family transcriptional regulator, regulatory protein PadR
VGLQLKIIIVIINILKNNNCCEGENMAATEDYKTWVKMITGLYILDILERSPAHGNKIAEEIKSRTAGTLTSNPNALYPLLRVMEERNYIVGTWDNPDTRNRRVYTITETGVSYIPTLREKVAHRINEMQRKLEILHNDLFRN